MTDTKSQPPTMTEEERTMLTVLRASGLGLEKTCEVITRAVTQAESPDPDPRHVVSAEELAAETFRVAATNYHEAEERRDVVDRQFLATVRGMPDGAEKTRLVGLRDAAVEAAEDAERNLATAVQLLDPAETYERLWSAGYLWANRAARWAGDLYVSGLGEILDGGNPLLVIVDLDEVRDVKPADGD